MSIYRRKDRKGWRATLWHEDVRILTKTLPTEKAAKQWLSVTQADFLRGQLRIPRAGPKARLLFRDLANLFLDHAQVSCRPRTYRGYRSRLRATLIPAFGDRAAESVTRADVLKFRTQRLIASGRPSSVNHDMDILRALFFWAVERGHIGSNPAARIKHEHSPQVVQRRFYSHADVQTLLSKLAPASEELGLVVAAFTTGMRPRELAAFRLEWVDWTLDAINIPNTIEFSPKSHRPRTVPLVPMLRDWLLSLARTEGPVFQRKDLPGQSIGLKKLTHRVEEIRRLAGVRFNLYDARHTYASQLLAAGVPLHEVQSAMGHSVITTTMRYAHLSPEYLGRVRREIGRLYGDGSAEPSLRLVANESGHVPAPTPRPSFENAPTVSQKTRRRRA